MAIEAGAGSGLDVSASVAFALLSTIVLAALHLLAPRIRRLPLVPEYATASFAGGLAVSYVFLHLLPEQEAASERQARVDSTSNDQGMPPAPSGPSVEL